MDIGDTLNEDFLEKLINEYGFAISTILFMGGEHAQEELIPLVDFVKSKGLKAAWYCGRKDFNEKLTKKLDYFKIGPYIHELGPLNKTTTNQRLYMNIDGETHDITYKFWEQLIIDTEVK